MIRSIAPSSQDRVRGRTYSKAGLPVAYTIEKIESTGEIEHWRLGVVNMFKIFGRNAVPEKTRVN